MSLVAKVTGAYRSKNDSRTGKKKRSAMTKESMIDELLRLNAVRVCQAVKLAEDTATKRDATDALAKLRKLEREKPTVGELKRGATAGAIVGTGANLMSNIVSGGSGGGIRKALKAPTVGGKTLGMGKALFGGARTLTGAAASGATFGAGLPIVRRKLDVESEKETLRDYLDSNRRGGRGIRRQAKKIVGV